MGNKREFRGMHVPRAKVGRTNTVFFDLTRANINLKISLIRFLLCDSTIVYLLHLKRNRYIYFKFDENEIESFSAATKGHIYNSIWHAAVSLLRWEQNYVTILTQYGYSDTYDLKFIVEKNQINFL